MTDKNLLTLTINQHQKAYTLEQAFSLCKQLLVNNSPNFDDILRQVVDNASLEHNQKKHFFSSHLMFIYSESSIQICSKLVKLQSNNLV